MIPRPQTFTPVFQSLQTGQMNSSTETRGSPESKIMRSPGGNGSHSTMRAVSHRWQEIELRIVRTLLIATDRNVGLISFLQ